MDLDYTSPSGNVQIYLVMVALEENLVKVASDLTLIIPINHTPRMEVIRFCFKYFI